MMKRSIWSTGITALSALVVAPVFLFTGAVSAEPSGLEGSYFGTNIDRNRSLDLGYQFLLETEQPTDKIINSILGYPISRQGNASVSAPSSTKENETSGNSFQGRFDVPNLPLSVRGAAALSGETITIEPIVSYDVPVTNNANVYAGAGYSFVRTNGENTLQGNQDSVVLTTGVEAAVSKNIVIYGDAKLRLNSHDNSDTSPVKLQFGAGYRF